MYKMVLENEHAQGIISGLHEIAGVRYYDWWVLGVAIATFLVSSALMILSYKLNKKQSEILKQQNRIALLEKRLEAFNILGPFVSNVQRFYKKTCQRKDEGGTFSIQYYIQNLLLIYTKNPHKYKDVTKSDFQINSVNDLNDLKQAILLTQLIFNLDPQEQAELSELDMVLDLSYKLTGEIDISKNGDDALSYDKIIEILSHYSSINERSLLIDSLYEKMEVVHS